MLKRANVELHKTQILKFFFPGLTVPWPCLRRLYMDTWMTQQNRRLSGARPICAYGQTVWPCRMPLLRWQCFSSSAVGCQKWLCLPPSTVITSSKPSQVVKRIFEEPRSLLQRLKFCLFESLFPVEGRDVFFFTQKDSHESDMVANCLWWSAL